jgi:hypothetical protein
LSECRKVNSTEKSLSNNNVCPRKKILISSNSKEVAQQQQQQQQQVELEISDDDADELNEAFKVFEDLQTIGSDGSENFTLHLPIDALEYPSESISTESAKRAAGSPALIEYGFTVSLSNTFAAWDSQGRPQVFSDTMKRGLEQAVGLVFRDHWKRTYRVTDNVPEIQVLDVMRDHDEVGTEKLVQTAKAILQKNICNKQVIDNYIRTTFADRVMEILKKSEMFECKIMQKKCNMEFLERVKSDKVGLAATVAGMIHAHLGRFTRF